MTRDQPKNIAASIRHRLLTISREQKEDFQLVLTRYSLERFLYRLSQSAYRKTFVLKGALLFQVWTQESHRPTRDVDFLGHGEPSESRLREIVGQLCRIEVPDDGLAFDPDSIVVEPMKEEEKYQGIRIKLICRLASARIPVQIDIGFGDAVTPEPVEIDYPVILGQDAPSLLAYPRETVVSEKYQAVVSLGMTNSRMKDFFDLWCLSRQFDFDGELLSKAMRATFERRETVLPTEPPLALTDEFAFDEQKQMQWNAFLKRGALQVDGHSFGDVLNQLAEFLLPPSSAAARGLTFQLHWRNGGPWV